MPLFRVEDLKQATKIPYEKKNQKYMQRFKEGELDKIEDYLNQLIDKQMKSGENILTSSWIPGKNWEGTVFDPIYYVCNQNDIKAGMLFGTILFGVFMNRSEKWYYGRYQLNGEDIRGLTYFMGKS